MLEMIRVNESLHAPPVSSAASIVLGESLFTHIHVNPAAVDDVEHSPKEP